ncbi:MAG: patatin-like phospholipase family protein [Saprospiraceae bacterium]|nr:patatin-like phospholipase family protein [Saprospiraceae bacterium]
MANLRALPFQNIALSLSGGGYRAAAFHLGSMTYLNHCQWQNKPLLNQLVVLSTISGGTITGVKYALCLKQEKSFATFFGELYQFLKADTLLPDALGILNTPNAWGNSGKQRNLINSFARVYQSQLLDGQNFGFLLDPTDPQIPEFVFNSTDIEHQLAFRFQKRISRNALIGNGKADASISMEEAREILLGDIVAASSCFPGGFEPLIMPHDFTASDSSLLAVAWKGETPGADKKPLRLMDGGIVDNQGIEGVMNLDKSVYDNTGKPYVGTFIVSDVTTKQVDYPTETPGRSPILLNVSLRFYNLLAMILLAGLLALIWFTSNKWLLVGSAVLATICILWLVAGLWLTKKFIRSIKKTVSQESPSFLEDFSILRAVKLKYVVALLGVRVSALGRLADVFMKRIRELNQKLLFGNKHWRYRVVTNYIYDLSQSEPVDNNDRLSPIVKKANAMGTSLWFPSEENASDTAALEALIITGQATMCHNILEYIEKIRKERDPELPAEFLAKFDQLQPEIEQLKQHCLADFARFNTEPEWLFRQMQPGQG